MTVITRFAPSPTGYLHIGGARTALFNYLFAKHHNGKFLLRIEDTDKERSTKEATEAIYAGLKWLGLNWDGEAVIQSTRAEIHKKAALDLISSGKAYFCFTQQAEIDELRTAAIEKGEHFIFHSPWRDEDPTRYPKDINPVVRLKAPRTGQTVIHDRLQGDVIIENDHLDDMILLRSDGTATYMLAVVVDDHKMGVTHIIRGDDHLTNASRQILIYQAFGWEVPTMVHIPLIYGTDGAKLSKRHGALGVEAYKDMGYLPESLTNYLLRLGWGHGDEEIIPMDKAIEWFDIDGLGLSPARLDFAKMNHLNAHYLRAKSDEELMELVINLLNHQGIKVSSAENDNILKGMPGLKPRAELVNGLAELAKIYLIEHELQYSNEAKEVIASADSALVQLTINCLKTLSKFDKDTIQVSLKELAASQGLKIGELMHTIRPFITGMVNSPSVFEVISIIGKENSIKRLQVN
jgi:glutamyl-tRNA synthetase